MRSAETKLDEAIGLAEAISLEIIHHEILTINTVRAATLIGTGTIARIAELAEEFDHPLIIINTTLSPVQHRNLEEGLGRPGRRTQSMEGPRSLGGARVGTPEGRHGAV